MRENSNLDVLLVVPPLFRFIDIDMQSYPLGLGYIVSYLKQTNIRAEIYNADYIPRSPNENRMRTVKRILSTVVGTYHPVLDIAKRWPSYYQDVLNTECDVWDDYKIVLQKTNPKIIGISSRIVDITSTFIMARIARQLLPRVKIIVGGASASSSTDYLLANEDIDCLVLGEGEQTMRELTTHILSGRTDWRYIKGITYVKNGITFKNEPGELISNLDDIPFPDRDAMFILDINKQIKYIHMNTDIITSRGCPYACKFCSAYTAWGTRKPRMRSVSNIIHELVYLHTTYGQNDFIFWDDLFTSNRERVVSFCNRLIELKLNIKWRCLVRINTIDTELLTVMRLAGCYEIQIGIESGNDRILKHIGKNLTLKQIREQLPVLRKSGMDWLAFFIIGFPTETESEIQDTINFIHEITPTAIAISVFSPYPGTEFYNELNEKGLLGDNVMKSDVWYINNNYTGTMSDDKFKSIAEDAFRLNDNYNGGRMKLLQEIRSKL